MDDRTSTACCHCRLFLQAPLAMAQLTKIRRKRSEPCRSRTFYERLWILPKSPRVKTTGLNKKRLLIATDTSTWVKIWDKVPVNSLPHLCRKSQQSPLANQNTCWCLQKKAHLLYLVHILSFYTFLHAKTEMSRLIATWLHSNIVRCTRSRNWLHSCRCQFPHFLQAHPVAITHGATQRLFHKHQGHQ